MKMVWHHLSFSEKDQIAFGEYTFQTKNRYHGVGVLKIKGDKISNWRQYQYKSDLDWKEFVRTNDF